MTIRRGENWGERAPLPADGIIVGSDHEARVVIEAARRANEPIPTLGLVGGDLCRTLGGTGDRSRLAGADAMTFPIDVGAVLLDGKLHWFVAHCIARRRLWWGRAVAIMNAQWLGDWDLGPRSHPNDGLLDITDGNLPLGQRGTARARVRTGTHLPHPALTTHRVSAWTTSFDRPVIVRLDGQVVAATTDLEVRVEADALRVVV